MFYHTYKYVEDNKYNILFNEIYKTKNMHAVSF